MAKTGAHLKIVPFGDNVLGVRLLGDPRSPEPSEFRVAFPGGDITVARCTDGSYWAHVRCDHPEHGMFVPGDTIPAHITETRIDSVDADVKPLTPSKGVYHVAVRVRTGA